MTKNKRSIGIIGSKNSSTTLFQLKTSIPFVLLSSHWQSTPPLFESFQVWADPICEERYDLRLHGSMTTDFSSSTLKKRSGDEEWILQTFLQKIVPRAESSLLLFLLQHMSSERTGSFKTFSELYKFTLEHDGQLDFPVEELKSGLTTGRWSQGSELVEQLKEGYIKLCGTRSFADIGAELQNFQREQGALAPIRKLWHI
ncbi:hypothetical protein FOXG_06141 [Fusarium oxysporum f. sp. lycopersici 4287]|uniref:Uncharacterized protein n=1 Tax=Fusarium oxysporum f. sp. lycopersici (strain 4287 / CBS 123668 / FGSC 9935 / NRRL 34936) TaxID=426428 RepID=A0A0J9UWH8_FUSO4|nr:hypothetical protein FOXG_06141 [Fusarium oxysporum f. sp. lycopersici 4287]KNB03759.1 hypothetical protein FOXG_06141 [Fusarium oxysporum f. sp. lycopersici 4287]